MEIRDSPEKVPVLTTQQIDSQTHEARTPFDQHALNPRRIVVKLGTNVIMRPDGRVALGLLCGLVESIAALRELGREILVVSSGSIGLGIERLGLTSRPTDLAEIQACAAIGQSRLMSIYDDAFDRLGCRIAQVLLTEDDFRDPTRHANLRRTLQALLSLGVIPIVNENDTVSTLELDRPAESSPSSAIGAGPPSTERIFGDNDKLSALLMTHIDADLLVLLSDVDGLYDRSPSDPQATLIPVVSRITDQIRAHAHGGNGRGRGGMSSKLEAAHIVTAAGHAVVIANGRTPQVLERICLGPQSGSARRWHALPSCPKPERACTMKQNLTIPRTEPRDSVRVDPETLTDVRASAEAAKSASHTLAPLSLAQRNAALEVIAVALEASTDCILAANAEDLAAADNLVAKGQLTTANHARLLLSPGKLAEMVAQIRAVAALPDPLGRSLDAIELDHGLDLEKLTVPLGVLAVIFEARPDAVTQITALALKSGNAVLLKPGREVERTATALVTIIRDALGTTSIPPNAVALILGREQVAELLHLSSLIDLVIPRGSRALVEHIQANTRIPVLGHADGICHIYVDQLVNQPLALAVIDDAKTDYPAVCNAVETALVHEAIAAEFLPKLAARLHAKGVTLLSDDRTRRLLPGVDIAPVKDWHTEYGDLTLAVRVVDSLDQAIDHIHRYGSAHTESICTADPATAARFLNEVDAAVVLHNASTRFADGFRFGLGAEVGVSTSKIHARGPVGLEGLTTYKYIVRGEGHLAGDYRGPNARSFTHRRADHTQEGEPS